jgi:HSP20 family protein
MLRNIWDELEEMNRTFDETFSFTPTYRTYPFRRFFSYLPTFPKLIEKPYVPVIEVFAEKGDLVIKLELPGIDPAKDVSVTLVDGELLIKGVRNQQKGLKEKDVYRMETWYGEFERHFALPPTIDEKAIHVEYKHGILEVVVRGVVREVEAKKATAKTIPILVGEEAKELVKA